MLAFLTREQKSRESLAMAFGTKITLILTKIQVKELELYDQQGPRSKNPKIMHYQGQSEKQPAVVIK